MHITCCFSQTTQALQTDCNAEALINVLFFSESKQPCAIFNCASLETDLSSQHSSQLMKVHQHGNLTGLLGPVPECHVCFIIQGVHN